MVTRRPQRVDVSSRWASSLGGKAPLRAVCRSGGARAQAQERMCVDIRDLACFGGLEPIERIWLTVGTTAHAPVAGSVSGAASVNEKWQRPPGWAVSGTGRLPPSVEAGMKSTLAMLAGVTLVAACGPGGPETVGSDTTITPASPPSTDARYATGADDLLIRVDSGYGPALPALAVAGDGSVYAPAPPGGLAAPPPGPPATEVSVRRLTPEGLQLVMNRAAGLGLLGTPPDYDTDEAPTDQSYTTVTITDLNGRYVHRAYALGTVDPGSSDARDALDLFVGELHDLERPVGQEHIGPAEHYQPERWKVSIDGGPGGGWPTPDREWPFEETVRDGCAALEPIGGADIAGIYTADVDGSSEVVVVTPAFPWEC